MRLLIVGCGSIGQRHARNAAGLAEVGLVDADAAKADALVASGGGHAFATMADALAWAPEAAIVAAPNRLHLPLARTLVEAGAHVLLEKPISHTLAGVDDLLADAARRGCRVHVACNMRFHAGPATLRVALDKIGTPRFARAHFGHYLPNMRPDADYRTLYCARRATGGGVILDGIHELDYLAWLLGPVVAVGASAGTLSDLDIDVEDYATLSLEHAGGARSEIHLDYLQRIKRRGCELVGSDGTLVWESEGKAPEILTVRLFEAGSGTWRELAASDDLDGNAAYVAMLQAFLQAAAGRDGAAVDALLTGAEARNDLAATLAALQAAESGRRQQTEWRS